jgi:hypothetical protein
MAKLFETDSTIVEKARDIFEETGLPQMGINLRILSTPKAKSVLKISRTNATTNFLTKNDIIMLVYEEAFDRLPDETKSILLEGAISNVSYDTDKDKLNVETDIAREIFRMRHKYTDYVDLLETSYIIIEQIEDEERRRKEEEKLAKKEKKNNK